MAENILKAIIMYKLYLNYYKTTIKLTSYSVLNILLLNTKEYIHCYASRCILFYDAFYG